MTITTINYRQHVIDGGWDFGCIEDTAREGVSEVDEERIRAHFEAAGLVDDDLDDAVSNAVEGLHKYCIDRVAERRRNPPAWHERVFRQ